MSKSALVREYVRVELSRPIVGNGLLSLVGLGAGAQGERDDSVNHDKVIYEWGYDDED